MNDNMPENEEGDRRSGVCKLVFNYLIKVMASLVLPLTLGMFTIFFTLHQQDMAMKQRAEDRQLVREQRMEDQRELQLQRKQEWEIATRQYEADNQARRENYQDEIVTAYFKEIGDLIERNNGSLMFTKAAGILARVKTLNIIRQLDGSRNKHVVRFLYESKQLSTEENCFPLDLAGSDLLDIDFTHARLEISFEHFSLQGIFMKNCSFSEVHLLDVDFCTTTTENVNFSYADLDTVDFGRTDIINSTFEYAELYDVDFSDSELVETDFIGIRAANIDFSGSVLDELWFTFAYSEDTDFSSCEIAYSDLTESLLCRVNFESADISDVSFEMASINDGEFSEAILWGVSFISAKIDGGDFSYSRIGASDFSFTSIKTGDFSATWLNTVYFDYADLYDIDFNESDCAGVTFQYSNLTRVVFWRANLKDAIFIGASFVNVNFSLANLQGADFTNTTIDDDLLWSALSIRNALLPNVTLARGRNLLQNGDADCNTDISDHWRLDNTSSVIIVPDQNSTDCHFTLQSHTIGGNISQYISLPNIWDPTYWTYSHAILYGRMSSEVSIHLIGRNKKGKVLDKAVLDSTKDNITMFLHKNMRQLDVVIIFAVHEYSTILPVGWCDDIELFIDYDITEPSDDD